MRIHPLFAAIGATALSCVIAMPACAQAFMVGRLLCVSTPRIGRVLGSTQSLRCTFHARNPPRQHVYTGQIRRVGLDLGATSAGVLSWAVFARNSRIRPSTLRGTYVGASGKVAAGPGFGVNVLVGGSRRTLVVAGGGGCRAPNA